jgi:hypothetical protein
MWLTLMIDLQITLQNQWFIVLDFNKIENRPNQVVR